MTPEQIEIQVIAAVVGAACAIPGAFLVLRRVAMLSDAITHAILPGIVIAFFLTESLHSPWLLVGASLAGVLTVAAIEALVRTRRVKEDAAIGIVFPVLFSVGVVLIARYATDVHLDVDAVLLGELAFAPFDRLRVWGLDVPKALATMAPILALNALFVAVFWKELKLSTFDAGLAAALGFAPAVLHYGLMGLVSLTAVGAFDAVGSVLVVALIVAPPAAAYLLTDRLSAVVWGGAGLGAVSGVAGYWLANALDTNIAGAVATVAGLVFTLALAFAPERGLVAQARRRRERRQRFAETMLAVHLLHHERTPEEARECRVDHLQEHLRWTPEFARQAVRRAERHGRVTLHAGGLALTPEGRAFAQEAMVD